MCVWALLESEEVGSRKEKKVYSNRAFAVTLRGYSN